MENAIMNAVTITDGKVTTTSLKIAEVFGKEHSKVMRAIKLLQVPEEFSEANFGLVEYEDAKGEKRPMYIVTRDGFTLLAMGFTGAKAIQFKIGYIDAFNRLEEAIKTPAAVIEQMVKSAVAEAMPSQLKQLRYIAALESSVKYLKHFAPTGEPGELNDDGIPKTQFRRGYFVSRNGRSVTALIEHPELPGLFSEYHLAQLGA